MKTLAWKGLILGIVIVLSIVFGTGFVFGADEAYPGQNSNPHYQSLVQKHDCFKDVGKPGWTEACQEAGYKEEKQLPSFKTWSTYCYFGEYGGHCITY